MEEATWFSRDRCWFTKTTALSASRGSSGLRLTESSSSCWRQIEILEPGHPVFRVALGLLREAAERGPHKIHAQELLAHVVAPDEAALASLEVAWWNRFRRQPIMAFPELDWKFADILQRAGITLVGDVLGRELADLRAIQGIGDRTTAALGLAYHRSFLPEEHP